MNTSFLKSPWLLAGVAALALFALSFVAINYVGKPDGEKAPKVEKQVIATVESNPELIELARQQGWIKASATEMTSVDAAKVTRIDSVFAGSKLKSFDEFRFFVGVHEIPTAAFAHADDLRSIIIPAYVADIKNGALAYCPNLERIAVDTANTHYDSRGDCNAIVCTWKGKLMVVAGCRTTVIPDGVRFLAAQAFCGVRGLKTIAFPERFDEIGEAAFRDCADLETIELPQGMRFVEDETFRGCKALQSVRLTKSIERLRKDAFADCPALKTVVSPKRYPPIIENAFDRYDVTFLVPSGMKSQYASAQTWKPFKNIKELPKD